MDGHDQNSPYVAVINTGHQSFNFPTRERKERFQMTFTSVTNPSADRISKYIGTIEPIVEGKRNYSLYTTGLSLRSKFGLTGADLDAALSEVNQAKCTPPLDKSEVVGIARSIGKTGMPAGEKTPKRGKKASKPTHRTVYTVSPSDTFEPVAELLQKEVCIYQDCYAKTPIWTGAIHEVLEGFKTGGKSGALIDTIRNTADKDERNELKKKLHAVVFASEPQEERKATACIPNGILCLDFDGIPAEELGLAKAKFWEVPYVFAVGLSVGGGGIFALVAYEGMPDLKQLIAAMQADFPYELDKSCSDVSRLRFVTFDPDLVVKDHVAPAILTERTEADSEAEDIGVPEKTGIEALDFFLQQIEEISFSASESGKVKHNDYYIGSIDHLLRTARLNLWDIGMKNGAPHFYNGRLWQRIDKDIFRHALQVVGVKQGIPHRVVRDHLFVDKLEKQFVSEARFPVPSTNDSPKINLRNGTIHITPSGTELKPFDKMDGLTYQLDCDYDEAATAPLFQKFLNRVLPDIAVRKLVAQYIAYVFLRNLNLEKVLFLYGGGANGKSVLLNIIRALVGAGQCCEFSLEGITEKECQRAELGHHLLNVSTEISTRLKTEIFKKIASREPLQARYLYKQPFTMQDYATSIFAMNELPRDVEQTDAFFRRFLIIPFNVRIPEEEQDPELAQKIIGNEMSGVLNWVIRGMQSLIDEQQFDIPDIVRGAVSQFRQESDSVLSHLVEHEHRIGDGCFISLADMYNSYRQQCTSDGSKPVSKRNFAKRLRELGYRVEKHGHDRQTVVFVECKECADDDVPT